MTARRSLRLPIMLGIVMIAMLVALTVGWVLLAIRGISESRAALYWTLLPLGTTFLVLAVVGVVVYLTLSVKAINLTRRQSNFIDSVTHELKSPIASLKLYLQTLRRRPVSREEQAEFYQFMLEDVERLDKLINHMLAAARLEKTADQETLEIVRLEQLLHQCASAVRLRYRVPPETIQTRIEPCLLAGRRVDLELIFRNLIDNAVKYADAQQPQVSVESSFVPEQAQAVIRILDNGPGIPAKLRRKVFGRFVRLGTELEREKAGTGLGLYIVRTLVARWRGRIRVIAREGQVGSCFQVTLPGAFPPDVEATVPAVPIGQSAPAVAEAETPMPTGVPAAASNSDS
jgi:signal transduction histidine kinase